jgi:hypothetical protein
LTTVLVLKLCLVPSLIYLVTLAGRRWGPNAAGWLSALPIVAGPILLTMAIEQGSGFVATAAAHTLIAVIAVLVFCLAYAWASGRFGVPGSLLAALTAYAAAGIGPRLSGFFAMFPVMGTILVGFSHAASGREDAVNILLGMVRGYYAFATFCVVLSLLLRGQSIGLAFCLAAGAALMVQVVSRRGLAVSMTRG